ncbi:MAG: serine/threonine protein kinase [Polyangiaceae bacterium]|nr:serine/threonine protein kinase [Polyangiaceae bacterium]
MADTRRDPFRICGTTIAEKYRIESVVGAGGFGVVYRAVHEGFGGEPIAVKCLLVEPELSDDARAALLGKLQDEAKVLHRLSKRSPSIVQALDVGAFATPGGQWVPYLVLEWLEGRTLAAELEERRAGQRGGMPLAEVMATLEPVASALAVAHRQRVAHRDVKPENIFLAQIDGTRTPKLLDFGIAKVLGEQAHFTASPVGTRLGPSAFTPQYGAPEQFNKRRGASGPWTDVFALGLVLYEMLTGERALEGDDPAQLYVSACSSAERPSLAARGVGGGAALDRVLSRALEVDPERRYRDAEDLWQALCAAASHPDRVSSRGEPADTGEWMESRGIVIESPGGARASGFAPTESRARTFTEDGPASAAHDTRGAGATTTGSPSSRFEVAVIELASRGTPLTVANVVATLGVELADAESELERMADSGRLEREPDTTEGLVRYRVRGLTLARRPPSLVRELVRDPLWRWLAIDPRRPVGVPAFLRKNGLVAVALGTVLPGVGLLYAAPFWSSMLVLLLSSIVIGLAATLPLIGPVFRWAMPALVAAVSGFFGWVYAWHYNRNGWRTTLRGARAAAERLRASQATLPSAVLPPARTTGPSDATGPGETTSER